MNSSSYSFKLKMVVQPLPWSRVREVVNMWTTLFIVTAIFLIALRIFLTVHNQIEVISAGLVAAACMMIALGVSPLVLKLFLLLTIFLIERWLLHRELIAES